MKVTPLKLNGAAIIEPVIHGDNRGYFMEIYNQVQFLNSVGSYNFIQDNHSFSKFPGVIRGLHYQLNPKAQTKLLFVLSGAIYDVIVDIRKNSPTFGKWSGIILSQHNHRQLLVPKGFAHGFCTLTPETQIMYKVDEYYSKEHDRGILWNDPSIGIDWPISDPILSEKDQQLPVLGDAELNFEY